MTKKFVKTFRVDNKANKRLESLMEKLDLNLTDTINKIIEDTIKGEPFTTELEICHLLVNLEGQGYYCVQNSSKPRKLGDGSKKHADILCEKCQYHKKLLAEIEKLKGEPWRTKIPYCVREETENHLEDNSLGEKLFCISITEQEGFGANCPLESKKDREKWYPGKRSIKLCQVKNKGKECRYLKWFEIESVEISNVVKEWF